MWRQHSLEVEAYSVNKKRGWNRLRKGRIVSEVGDGVRRKGWWWRWRHRKHEVYDKQARDGGEKKGYGKGW